MRLNDYYNFGSRLSRTTFQARPESLRARRDDGNIPDTFLLTSGKYDDISFPVIFSQECGKTLCDVVDTGSASLYLISEEIRSTLEANRLSGWKSFPIRLFDKNGREINGYEGLSITGRCGPIDVSKSEVIYKRTVPEGPITKYYKGLFVGLDGWDGTDFFLPTGYYGPVVTKRAAGVLTANKLTNIKLRNLADIEIDEFTAKMIALKSLSGD